MIMKTIESNIYTLENTGNLISPALIYYKDIILDNTKRIIKMAGSPEKLWPHVKSHKTPGLISMQLALGIDKFKCATIAEAEMTASCGAKKIILAYPLIGPNISRYLHLVKAFPETIFYAIGDNLDQLSILAKEASGMGMNVNVLVDVDIGMHRTGVPLDSLETFYERSSFFKGISLRGLHCYDGQCKDPDLDKRKAMALGYDRQVLEIKKSLEQKGLECEIMVMGGTPSFPCRAGKEPFFLSPGTLFIGDWGYYANLPDLAFTPGAVLFTRVVSQGRNTFTLDLGSKGIATDPPGVRGIITGLKEAEPLFQSEEHWVFSLPENTALPAIGSEFYVIPTHICPTSALYPEILVAEGGKITESWQVSARNRKIKF